MARLKQHRPGSIDSDEPLEEVEFAEFDDLKEVDWVRRFVTFGEFHQFSVSHTGLQDLLMAEYEEGKVWWVVGYLTLDEGEDLGLPDWKAQ